MFVSIDKRNSYQSNNSYSSPKRALIPPSNVVPLGSPNRTMTLNPNYFIQNPQMHLKNPQ
jgi:hypothetical protein